MYKADNISAKSTARAIFSLLFVAGIFLGLVAGK